MNTSTSHLVPIKNEVGCDNEKYEEEEDGEKEDEGNVESLTAPSAQPITKQRSSASA